MNDQSNATAPTTDSKDYACGNHDCPLYGPLAPFDITIGPESGQPYCNECKEPAVPVSQVEAQRTNEVDQLLNSAGVSREDVGQKSAPDSITSTQLGMIRSLATDSLDVDLECRKFMQCEISELSQPGAEFFIRHLRRFSDPTDSDERQLISEKKAEAETNTEAAAKSVHAELAPEFGSILAKHEPTALAYGFPPAVDALIEKAKLSPEQTGELLAKFGNLFAQINDWRQQVETLVIRDENDDEGIKKAKEIAKAMADDRLNAEKRKKIIKEPYLRPSQLIDGVFKIYIDEAGPIEKMAIAKAKTKELAEQARKEKIRDERAEQLAPYVENPRAFDLLNMTDEAFEVLLKGQKEAFEAREADRRRQEEERQRKEDEAAAERVKIRRQNERTQQLSSLGFVRDAENKRYQLEDITVYDNDIEGENDVTWLARIQDLKPKAEAIRTEQNRKRTEAEKALKDQQERERLEKDENFRKEREAEAVALAPDKIKLARLAEAIDAIEFFETSNEKIIEILSGVKGDLFNTVTKLKRQIDQLP